MPTIVTTYKYDEVGNLIEKTDPDGTTYYTYDECNNLVAVETPTMANPVMFTYNALGQRVKKESSDGSITKSIFDGSKLLQQTDGDDEAMRTYTSTIDEFGGLVAEYDEFNDAAAYPVYDAQPNAQAQLDDNASFLSKFRYQAFGDPAAGSDKAWCDLSTDQWSQMGTNDWSDLEVCPSSNFTYGGGAGYGFDNEIHLFLLGMGVKTGRYYDPTTGRFLTRDSIGVNGDAQGNAYRYVGNNPINATDPSGAATRKEVEKKLAENREFLDDYTVALTMGIELKWKEHHTPQTSAEMAVWGSEPRDLYWFSSWWFGRKRVSRDDDTEQKAKEILQYLKEEIEDHQKGFQITDVVLDVDNFKRIKERLDAGDLGGGIEAVVEAGLQIAGLVGGVCMVLKIGTTAGKSEKLVRVWKKSAPAILDDTAVHVPKTEQLGDIQAGIIRAAEKTEGDAKVVSEAVSKPPVKKPSPQKGGPYEEVRAGNAGGEVHHTPAASVSPYTRVQGPSVWMETVDHRRTASWGNSKAAQVYRQRQADLIMQGRLRDAIQMDIDDIRSKFDSKYDQHISEMLKAFGFSE